MYNVNGYLKYILEMEDLNTNMKKILTKKGRIITLIAFIILTVVSIILSPLVTINYDMRKYLASDSNTREALVKLMKNLGLTQ